VQFASGVAALELSVALATRSRCTGALRGARIELGKLDADKSNAICCSPGFAAGARGERARRTRAGGSADRAGARDRHQPLPRHVRELVGSFGSTGRPRSTRPRASATA
jgi:hypothetical protein